MGECADRALGQSDLRTRIITALLSENDVIRCVTCNVACDSSGLCNDHRYDEQPRQPGLWSGNRLVGMVAQWDGPSDDDLQAKEESIYGELGENDE